MKPNNAIKFLLYIIICYLIGSANLAIAQWTWAHAYGGNIADWFNSMQITADGGYILAGYTMSFGAGSEDALVLKLNSAGAIIWQNTYGGKGEDYAYSIQQTSVMSILKCRIKPLEFYPGVFACELPIDS